MVAVRVDGVRADGEDAASGAAAAEVDDSDGDAARADGNAARADDVDDASRANAAAQLGHRPARPPHDQA